MKRLGQIAVRILGGISFTAACSGQSVDFRSSGEGGSGASGSGGQAPELGCVITYNGIVEQVTYDRVFTWRSLTGSTPTVIRLFNADGNIRIHARAKEQSYTALRVEMEYDAQGNLIESASSDIEDLDVSKKSAGPPDSLFHYEHGYGPDGRLAVTQNTSLFVSQVTRRDYVSDDSGRCSEVTRTREDGGVEVETRTHVEERLVRWRQRQVFPDYQGEAVVTYRYDGEGRLVSTEQDGSLLGPPAADGAPDIFDTHEYAADGSVKVTQLNFISSETNDQAYLGDVLRPVLKRDLVFTPACAEIYAQMPRRQALSCAFPDRPWVHSYLDILPSWFRE